MKRERRQLLALYFSAWPLCDDHHLHSNSLICVSNKLFNNFKQRQLSVSFGVWLLFFHPTELQLNASLCSKPTLQFTSEFLMLSPHLTAFGGNRGGPATHIVAVCLFLSQWQVKRRRVKSYSEVGEEQRRLRNKMLTKQIPQAQLIE